MENWNTKVFGIWHLHIFRTWTGFQESGSKIGMILPSAGSLQSPLFIIEGVLCVGGWGRWSALLSWGQPIVFTQRRQRSSRVTIQKGLNKIHWPQLMQILEIFSTHPKNVSLIYFQCLIQRLSICWAISSRRSNPRPRTTWSWYTYL